MGVHVSDAAQINKQGIPFLNAKQHTVDRQARGSIGRQVPYRPVRRMRCARSPQTKVDEVR